MRGIPSSITSIRKQVFTEVARLAYDGDYQRMEEIPYTIIPGEEAKYRESIFLERAIVGERVRVAMGLPLQPVDHPSRITEGLSESAIADKYYDPPLINIINYACHACPTKQYRITEYCQGCLARSCQQVCPKDAIRYVNGKSYIKQDQCIKCGRCAEACQYNAIIKLERPCQKACGMDAIGADDHGRAKIDYDKCVSCGMCLVNCPFGAIVDKGQIFQLIHAIKRGDKVVAIVAPAFLGQFGPEATPERLTAAMKRLGFAGVAEVAVGADLCTIEEAKDFMAEVPEKQPFMGTSCCPAWSVMAKKLFPQFKDYISMALTPMVLTARLQKKKDPSCRVCFIGPCAAKKLEASRRTIRSDVDFVLTFEELQGMFEARNVRFEDIPPEEEVPLNEGTGAGRGFAVSGGVANAVVEAIKRIDPDREVKVAYAEGLDNCKKMLMLAKAGKYNGYLLEGMGCPGGCIGGAGTIADPVRTAVQLNKYVAAAPFKDPEESAFITNIHLLKDDPDFE